MSESLHSEEYRLFVTQLRAARAKSGLSQRELAARLRKSYSYVAKIETGATRMDIYQIRCYLCALNEPFVEFMQSYDILLSQAGL